MLSILSCIVYEHDPLFLGLAIGILLVGSIVTMRLFARVRRTESSVKLFWLCLAGVIGGSTIWSTHFVAMLAYETPIIAGFDPVITLLSLFLAIFSTTTAFYITSSAQKSLRIEFGGLVLGLGISAMHYLGMSAMVVSGRMQWDWVFVATSIVIGSAFAIISMSRIARPVTRYCKYGASLAFFVAVASMHFTGMTALEIEPQSLSIDESMLISGQVIGYGVMVVMGLLFLIAFATYSIDLKNAEQSSRHFQRLAMQDPLTGLANRLGCEVELSRAIEAHVDDTARLVVVAIDLDRFKEVNDVHGHAAGDHMLRTLAERISDTLSDNEMIGRIGGDEFLAIKKDAYSLGAAREFSEKICQLANAPIQWEQGSLIASASIGYSVFPDHDSTGSKLLAQADLAMYRAKSSGRNQVCAYDHEMDEANREKSALALDLAKAVKNNELQLYYQLQNNAITREISGVEALLRWHHPDLGIVSPGIFIPIAEEYGLIGELGDWVLQEACNQAKEWENPIKVAINVATPQLADPAFPSKVENALKTSGLCPSRLELEITESGIISEMGHALQIIRQLKRLGVKLAMDDFGTGYSSLATLQAFPFDKIKIDREFIREVNSRKQSAAIVRATIILGESLDIPVLAEGVETEEHMAFLKEEGCNEVQGFLFGKPMPGDQLSEMMASDRFAPALRKAS